MKDLYAYLIRHPSLAGGMMAIVALAAVFVALPLSSWYHA